VVLRTHARIANLLDREQTRKLAEAEDINDFLEKLKETPYGEIVIEHDNLVAINLERVFTEKFIERIESIVRITPTKLGEFLRAYFDLRFEVLNLKRILRGKFTESTIEQIKQSLIPIEPFLIDSYETLLTKRNFEETVELLQGTPYKELITKLPEYEEKEELWPFELELNYIYAKEIMKLVGKLPSKNRYIVNSLVKFETDVENILVAIKRRGKGRVNLEEVFPVTYRISLDELEKIIKAEDLRTAIDSLNEPYKSVLQPIKTGDIALTRAMLRKGKYETVTTARAGDEYGFNVILAFLIYSEIEKDNLVGLAWGKVQGLESTELLKYIVIPWD
jgi:vacuolar-type H+-ATPase subunit C/Vma6